jgi:hypothetical protein
MIAFRDLCPRLGRVARLQLDLGRPQKKDPGRVAVRWPCGCHAWGERLGKVTLETCAQHVDLVEQGGRQTASARA